MWFLIPYLLDNIIYLLMMVEFALGIVQFLQIAKDVFSSHQQFPHLH